MGTKIGDLANSYHTAFNNQLNAQKAYIDSYITGINARNAVNQEARTKDQYWNYTQPFQASNLANTLAKNNIETGILTNQDYINNIQGYSLDNAAKQFKLGRADMDNLANYIEIQRQNSNTGLNNAKIASSGSAEALSLLPTSQKLIRNATEAALVRQPKELEFAKVTAEQNLENAKNPTTTQIFGENPNGTPATIMLPNGSTPSKDKYWTDRFLNPTVTTPASGLPSNPSNTQKTGQQQVQTGQVNLNSNPYYQNYSADQLQSALGNLTSSTDSILGSTPDILLSPERRARKIAFNQNYELMIQARDAKIAEQKAQQQIENQAYLKRLTDKALERQRTNSGLK